MRGYRLVRWSGTGEGSGVAAGVVQSLMQASGQAVPHAPQMCAVSVRPSPVSTSALSMSKEPQSGQTGSW